MQGLLYSIILKFKSTELYGRVIKIRRFQKLHGEFLKRQVNGMITKIFREEKGQFRRKNLPRFLLRKLLVRKMNRYSCGANDDGADGLNHGFTSYLK